MTQERTIALLRAVNVGGTGKLKMADLRASLGAAGYRNVRTYIQSGNVVIDGPVPPAELQDHLAQRHGLKTAVICLLPSELDAMIAQIPWSGAENLIALALFCDPSAQPDLDTARAVAARGEAIHPLPRALAIHYPNGQANSRLASGLERHLGICVTVRNLRTARKLLQLATDP